MSDNPPRGRNLPVLLEAHGEITVVVLSRLTEAPFPPSQIQALSADPPLWPPFPGQSSLLALKCSLLSCPLFLYCLRSLGSIAWLLRSVAGGTNSGSNLALTLADSGDLVRGSDVASSFCSLVNAQDSATVSTRSSLVRGLG